MTKYSGSKRSKNKCSSVELSIGPSSYYNSPISVHHYTLTVLHFSFDNSLKQIFVSFYTFQRRCSICKRQFIFHFCLLMTMRVLARIIQIFLFLLAHLIKLSVGKDLLLFLLFLGRLISLVEPLEHIIILRLLPLIFAFKIVTWNISSNNYTKN